MTAFSMPIMSKEHPGPFVWEPTTADIRQAYSNHGQTLERLKERGGLAWIELANILLGRRWGSEFPDRSEFFSKRVCEDALKMPGRTEVNRGE